MLGERTVVDWYLFIKPGRTKGKADFGGVYSQSAIMAV